MKIYMRMGERPDASYVLMTAIVQVLPGETINYPFHARPGFPGYDKRYFDIALSPVMYLKVKAGTSGVILITLWAEYHLWEVDKTVGMPIPKEMEGEVICSCTWDYKCTPEGVLSLTKYEPEDSPTSNHFSVTVGRADRAIPNPPSGLPSFRMRSTSVYAGFSHPPEDFGTGYPIPGSGWDVPRSTMDNPELTAYLEITDKVVPPPPPPKPKPTPTPTPVGLSHTVYFKTGEANADRFPHPDPRVALKDQIKGLQVFMNGVESKHGLKNIVAIEVHGYASGLDDTRKNINLSQKRAEYIAQLLRQLYHIQLKEAQITPHGEPPIPGNDKEDKQENRRADLVIKVKKP
jgi:outer membrane protein OmpA-like peptidoglycan-associated protein